MSRLILYTFILATLSGCAAETKFVLVKCGLPAHEKPNFDTSKPLTDEEFLRHMRTIFTQYDILLNDYNACRK